MKEGTPLPVRDATGLRPTSRKTVETTTACRSDVTALSLGPWYRKGPFFEAARRHGARVYSVYNHTYLPAYYEDPVEELLEAAPRRHAL